ncbi:kanadaptin [Hyperolius riggenbachi]|uniref:kanadaptin n=1 Tax=Hyperolius riggenbachi TaxID=752182 RepID=UPI0035A35AA5
MEAARLDSPGGERPPGSLGIGGHASHDGAPDPGSHEGSPHDGDEGHPEARKHGQHEAPRGTEGSGASPHTGSRKSPRDNEETSRPGATSNEGSTVTGDDEGPRSLSTRDSEGTSSDEGSTVTGDDEGPRSLNTRDSEGTSRPGASSNEGSTVTGDDEGPRSLSTRDSKGTRSASPRSTAGSQGPDGWHDESPGNTNARNADARLSCNEEHEVPRNGANEGPNAPRDITTKRATRSDGDEGADVSRIHGKSITDVNEGTVAPRDITTDQRITRTDGNEGTDASGTYGKSIAPGRSSPEESGDGGLHDTKELHDHATSDSSEKSHPKHGRSSEVSETSDSFKKPTTPLRPSVLEKTQPSASGGTRGPTREAAPDVSSRLPSDAYRQSLTIPYREPSWSGRPQALYSLEMLKGGAIVSTKALNDLSWTVFGRLPVCHISLEHPSVSRFHAILQYRAIPGSEPDQEPGFYVFDMDSTHGTFINKQRIPPKTYCRFRVGHVLKFGGSTRLFVLQSILNTGMDLALQAWSSDTCVLGLRSGEELEFEYEERGPGSWLCRIKLPADDSSGKQLVAEISHSGKKKEAGNVCALEACRMLDMRGLLRQEAVSRKRKSKNWEDEDFYDSDDDTFLDRTGVVEKKRLNRMKKAGKIEEKPETFESLSAKLESVEKEIVEIAAQLRTSQTGEAQASSQDSLDAFMTEIKAGSSLDSVSRKKLHLRNLELKKEQQRLRSLIKIVQPTKLPELKTNPAGDSATKKLSLPMFGAMKGGRKFKLKTGAVGKAPPKRAELPASLFSMKDDGPEEEEDEDEEEVKLEAADNRGRSADDDTPEPSTKTHPTNVPRVQGGSSEDLVQKKRLEKQRPIQESSCNIQNPNGEQTPVTGKTNEAPKPAAEKQKKMLGPSRPPAGVLSPQYPEDDPDYCVWTPPTGQTGDGKTHLNEKYGY